LRFGANIRKRLVAARITTVRELWHAQPKHLRALWGNVNGERMWYALHGYDLAAQPTSRGMFGHARVPPPSWRDIDHAMSCSRLLLTKAARRMRRAGFYAGKVALWLDIRNNAWFAERQLPCLQGDHACLAGLTALWDQARRDIHPPAEIVRVGVTLGDLSPANARQLDLFLNDDRQRQRREVLINTIDRVNRKFGKRVLTLDPWTPPPGPYAGGKIAYNRIPSAEDFW
jgi:DNA polymerase-4